MRRRSIFTVSIMLLGTMSPAHAITGSRSAPADAIAKSLVTVITSNGGVCTGTLIAPTIILTAAHCTAPGVTLRVVDYTTKPPRLVSPQRVATHPQYNAQAMAAHRATADIALLLLPSTVPGKLPAIVGAPRLPVLPSSRFTVAGIGTTSSRADDVGVARAASLAATGQPGNLQIRLADPATQNKSAGMGACTGDSGAPAFEDQDGRSIIAGVVSWSTGPNFGDGCGGVTGITPLTLYRDWIVRTARSWGAAL